MLEYQAVEVITLQELLRKGVHDYPQGVAFQIRSDSTFRQFTFPQVGEMASRLQFKLKELGVVKGDRVALISENRPEWPISYLAIASLGAIVVPLDALQTKEEILPLLEDCEAKAIVLSQKFLEYVPGTRLEPQKIVMEEFDKLRSVVSPQPCPSLPDWQAGGRRASAVSLDDVAAIVYTSGTTGTPKGVMLTHRNISSNVISTASLFNLGPGDNFLSVLPLHHTFETTAGFLGPFYKGCTITYAESLKSHNLLKNMQETKVTIMCGVPLLYQLFFEGILREVEEKKLTNIFRFLFAIAKFFKSIIGFNLGKFLFPTVHQKFGGEIRFFVTGGAAIDPELLKNFEGIGFTLLQGYGLTESAPILTCNTLKENRLGSVGKPIPGVEIKISGGEEVGEILAFGPNIMKGYYKREDLTSEIIDQSGWLHTGDIGYLDEEGYLYITGRLKEVIVTASGVNVYPEELEFLLKKIPAIKEACVLGAKIKEGIRKGSEEVVAVVVPKEGFAEEAVKNAVAELNQKLADYKRIARVIIHKEELPKTRLLKIKKFEVRKELGL